MMSLENRRVAGGAEGWCGSTPGATVRQGTSGGGLAPPLYEHADMPLLLQVPANVNRPRLAAPISDAVAATQYHYALVRITLLL